MYFSFFLRSLLLAFSFFVLRSVRCGLCFSLLSGVLCNYVSLRSWTQKFNCFFVFRHKGVQLAGQQKELGAAIETVSGLELYFKIYPSECEGDKEPESSLSNRLKTTIPPQSIFSGRSIELHKMFLKSLPIFYFLENANTYMYICTFPKSFFPFALFSSCFVFLFSRGTLARTTSRKTQTKEFIILLLWI